ncbi:MAG: hypothetical protein L6R39_005911, partial [Caloplaca ligustica]
MEEQHPRAPAQVAMHSSDSENAAPRGPPRTRKIQRVQRPRQYETQEEIIHQHQPYVAQPQVKRQASRSRLLGIFGRTRSIRGRTPANDASIEGDDAFDQEGVSRRGSLSVQEAGDAIFADLDLGPQPQTRAPSSTKRSKSFKKEPSPTKPIPWDPPPLFQAYPQSVKHGTAFAPTVSADAVLRFHTDRKRKQRKRDDRDSIADEAGTSQCAERDGIEDVDLARKIYVLVTSGYVLQYAGDGSFDRLPEKIMPIGQDSAAFASDAIPGKHWVLQLSHALDENGMPKLEKKSFVKRLGFRGDVKRCSALNFLLILDNPVSLEDWLGTVKREFEAWGGKRYQPDGDCGTGGEEVVRTLQQKPSQRYPVKRDPNQFSCNAKEPSIAFDEDRPGVTPLPALRKHSSATQDSVHTPSTSNMTTSTDQALLDRLRNSPRMSYISTGAKTHATSRETSPVPSPTRLAFHPGDSSFNNEQPRMTERPVKSTGPPLIQHLPQQPLDHSLPSTLTRPLSTAKSSPRRTNPGAPNFSVPSFSKRYSSTYSTPPLSTTSSNTSNPSRKPTSPPTITEQRDDLQDIDDAAAEASATDPLDGRAS